MISSWCTPSKNSKDKAMQCIVDGVFFSHNLECGQIEKNARMEPCNALLMKKFVKSSYSELMKVIIKNYKYLRKFECGLEDQR